MTMNDKMKSRGYFFDDINDYYDQVVAVRKAYYLWLDYLKRGELYVVDRDEICQRHRSVYERVTAIMHDAFLKDFAIEDKDND